MGDLHTDWVRERATSFTSCDPDSPLTDDERAAVDRMAGEAGLVALGEAAHGSEAIIRAAGRVLRFLIRERAGGRRGHRSLFRGDACPGPVRGPGGGRGRRGRRRGRGLELRQ